MAFSPALRDLRRQTREDRSFVAKCYVMDNLSDPVILGMPELRALGVYLEPLGVYLEPLAVYLEPPGVYLGPLGVYLGFAVVESCL